MAFAHSDPDPDEKRTHHIVVELQTRNGRLSSALAALEQAGAAVEAIELLEATGGRRSYRLSLASVSPLHADTLRQGLRDLPGVTALVLSDPVLAVHAGGKIRVEANAPVETPADLSLVYTPGVARICTLLADDPERGADLTIKGNAVAVVSDGSAILGLGNLGPLAALPVMEGKAMIFKRFADINAFPLCLNTQDTDEIIRTVAAVAPVFGGINLEDIAAPRCFEVEERLQEMLDIPVFHDDQHGTAIVTAAA
ncbi:MAG: NAD-dependent malic enzyme, partial [Chloroflexi bacterium]|nr:NAD-dependent malic enzyme [Chloroflexota bacterium]